MSHRSSPQTFGAGIAETYQRFFVPLIPAPLAGDLIERASPRPGERVADVACGTGVVTRLAAERVGHSGTVVGVDPSADMLEVARSVPARSGATIEWHQAGAERLPLTDRSCDLVTCQLALMLVADRLAAVREMHRVLAPQGRVAINVAGTMQPPFAIMSEALARHVDQTLSAFVAAVFSMPDPSEMEHLLHAGGFADISVEAVTRTFPLGPPDQFLEGYINSTPLAVAEPKQLEQLQHEVVAAWQPFTDKGSLVVDQPIIVATARAD